MSADKSFRGTLLLLQNKTKRDPESYVDEFRTQLKHFEAVSKTLLSTPTGAHSSGGRGSTMDTAASSNPQFLAVMQFVCHVAYCYPQECEQLPEHLISLLRQGKEALAQETRSTIVDCLLLLRNKNIASALTTLPILFELLEARDKSLRKTILAHIVGDVRRINLPGAKAGSAAVNKNIQNFLFKIMDDDDAVQARSALIIMIDLYRRELWCNDKTVQVISKACFSRHTLILRMALHFFLMQMPKFSSVGSDDDDKDEIDPGRQISKLKHKLKHKAKTGKRERVLKSKVDVLKKKFDSDKREADAMDKQPVDPVRFLTDPQGFAERLLAKLSKTTERFEIRILMMSVLSRVVNEHELVLLGIFPLFERYVEPTQLHATSILALVSTCVHRLVPPEPLESLVRTIADRFVNDRSDRDSITIGINTIREICKRQPLAMNADLLADLVAYKQHRGERGVIMAARALLQLYREVNPQLLPVKLRGSKTGASDPNTAAPTFGAQVPLHDIPGLESLFGADGDDVANSEDLDGTESSNVHFTTDSDDDEDDGEWQLVTDDSDDDFENTEDDEDDEASSEGDEVPQLVPLGPAPTPATAVRNPKRTITAAFKKPDASGFVAADDMWDEAETTVAPPPKAKKHRSETVVEAVEESSEGDADDEEFEFEDDDDDEEGEDDADEDEDDGDSSGSGEWVNVSHSDDDDDDQAKSQPAVEPAEETEWYAETALTKRPSSKAGVSTAVSSAGKATVASTRVLTDEEFAKLRLIQTGGTAAKSKQLKGKELEKKSRMSRKDSLIHDLGERGALLNPATIETFTSKKRERDREKKIEEARAKRMDNNPFEARKKKKTKLTTTHREKQKVGKLYQMTKRSHRVAEKIKRSVQERGEHAKEMKKKSIKFRIARGWKA